MTLKMDFKSDLTSIVESYFSKNRIRYETQGCASDLAALYFEMRMRRIDSKPRSVFFSEQIHSSLGGLTHETAPEQRGKALQAWRAAFELFHIFRSGGDVKPYLSKGIEDSNSNDPMLWDWGIHHFHLNRKVDKTGFIERSDYLLFALIYDDAALFIDVRKHHHPEGLEWVRQDLWEIVHSNWPQAMYSHEFHGVIGDVISDKEKKVLRGKKKRPICNHVMELHGHAFAPFGGGLTRSGRSTLCRGKADKIVWDLERHEKVLCGCNQELRAAFKASSMNLSGEVVLRLALVEDIGPTVKAMESLQEDDCLSRDLCQMGFVVVEAESRRIIDVRESSALGL